jgi:hypothetical protein
MAKMVRLSAAVLEIMCFTVILLGQGFAGRAAASVARQKALDNLLAGRFKWKVSQPLVSPLQRKGDLTYSVKDPSIVYYQGRRHLFCTIRGKERSHQIEYLCFEDFSKVKTGKRQILKLSDGYFCAPQVFYFRPHRKWYLICQASDESWEPTYGASYATTTDIADPTSWSKLRPLSQKRVDGKAGLDFWVICDDVKAYLFFTTLDGRMWREQTNLRDFPKGWSEAALAIKGDIFEASHTYYLKGLNKYLTVVEAQAGGRRYYKAYLAEKLDGRWTSLAATREKPFAGPVNTEDTAEHWTDSFSHGELIRDGFDETLTVNPTALRFLFQGVSDEGKRGKNYGQIPWRLGMLTPVK